MTIVMRLYILDCLRIIRVGHLCVVKLIEYKIIMLINVYPLT